VISFCHGQEHQADRHIHMIMIGTDLDLMFDLLTGTQNQIDELFDGKRVRQKIEDYEMNTWLITSEFEPVSAIRRLLRSADSLIIHYKPGKITTIEKYLENFATLIDALPVISVIDEITSLDEMNHFHGTLTSSHAFQETLQSILFNQD